MSETVIGSILPHVLAATLDLIAVAKAWLLDRSSSAKSDLGRFGECVRSEAFQRRNTVREAMGRSRFARQRVAQGSCISHNAISAVRLLDFC